MYCYCIEKSEIQKKGPLIKMVPTLKIFGVVSRFLYSGGWQVCGGTLKKIGWACLAHFPKPLLCLLFTM